MTNENHSTFEVLLNCFQSLHNLLLNNHIEGQVKQLNQELKFLNEMIYCFGELVKFNQIKRQILQNYLL